MTKSEFTALLARKNGLQLHQAERLLNAILDSIEDALARDGRIAIPALGIFDVRSSPERQARNPASGERILVPESRVPRFRPASSLRNLLQM